MSKRFILLVIAYWVLGINLITIYLLGTLEMFLEMLDIDIITLPVASKYWLSINQYIEATLFGFLFALLFLFIHQFTERREIGRMSFGRIILTKTALYVGGFGIIFLVIYIVMVNALNLYPEGVFDMISISKSTLLSTGSFLLILISQIVILNFIIQADKTFGHSNLLNFLTGKYHKPVIEDRVFLFIDLKDSTTYAEELGNIKYSMLIKDCFNDLNTLVKSHRANIYQYVGDEVVITWPTSRTFSPPYCVDLFFAFKSLLEKKSKYYIDQYGFVPEFKAGVNGGLVTATEIGDIKRDIAYHGDVLNTAARIQGACNKYNQRYMIESKLLKKLSLLDNYESTFIGNLKLKGKQDGTDVYALISAPKAEKR
jgi:adenylate cyclase